MLAVVVGLACSSSDGDGTAGGGASTRGDGAQPAAATGGRAGAEYERYVLKQTFDTGIEVTSSVFNRIRRIPKINVCPGRSPKPGQAFEQDALSKYVEDSARAFTTC